jgi:predicted PhzF superfamily epimerase YddE/YHI9
VLDAQGMDEVRTQQVAAEVGFPETASLTSDEGLGERRCRIRYFRPVAEVGFCGRDDRQRRCAGRAAGRTGELWLVTSVGEVRVGTWPGNGRILASLTSVAPAVREVDEADLGSVRPAQHDGQVGERELHPERRGRAQHSTGRRGDESELVREDTGL